MYFQNDGRERLAIMSYLPHIQFYAHVREAVSWEEADVILTHAELTSDPTDVIYQAAIMLERVLGSDNLYTIELLCNGWNTLGLKQARNSLAVAGLFSRGIHLFNSYLQIDIPEERRVIYIFRLTPPVIFFDKLVANDFTPDFSIPLSLLLEMLVIFCKADCKKTTADVKRMNDMVVFTEYPVYVGFDLLCRLAYLTHREQDDASETLPHQIYNFGRNLLQMVPPLNLYLSIKQRSPTWLRDECERTQYFNIIFQCYRLWVIDSGSLYTLDEKGSMPINCVIKHMFVYKYILDQPLLDFVLNHAIHCDAVDQDNKTPYEFLQACRDPPKDYREDEDEYEVELRTQILSICEVITQPPHLPPLACLAAHATIRYRFPYGKVKYIFATEYCVIHCNARL